MEKEILKEYKLKSGNLLRIYEDDNAESPDYWGDDELFLVYDHRQFDVHRKGFLPLDIYYYLNKEEDCLDYSKYYIYPVFAYIHSGVSLSLQPNGDKWDTSTTGFILVTKTECDNEEEALRLAEGLIIDWNQYLSGEVYKFEVIKQLKYQKHYIDEDFPKDEIYIEEQVIDSVNGYYGDLKTVHLIMDFNDELLNVNDELNNDNIVKD